MSRAIHAAIAITGVTCALWPAASSARHSVKRPVAEARFGLVNAKAPRMGPRIVRRGGYTALTDMIRPRFFGGMTDIYPSAAIGLRLSVGSRYFARPNYWTTAEQATRGLLYDTRWRTSSGGMPSGFRRRTWAMTAGYDAEVLSGLVVGIEGGALKGRAIGLGPRGQAFRVNDRNANRAGLNPIATLAVRYAF
ncbi:MAG: hypothetical protein ABIQ43_08830 [Sphingomonas sp.]